MRGYPQPPEIGESNWNIWEADCLWDALDSAVKERKRCYKVWKKPELKREPGNKRLAMPPASASWTKEQLEKLRATHTVRELANRWHVSESCAYWYLKGKGVDTSAAARKEQKKKYKRLMVNELPREKLEELAAVTSNEDIAFLYGVSETTIWRLMRKYGIDTREAKRKD